MRGFGEPENSREGKGLYIKSERDTQQANEADPGPGRGNSEERYVTVVVGWGVFNEGL